MAIRNKNYYVAFSNALLTITMLSNNFNKELEQDASQLINFIFNAFKISDKEKAHFKEIALNDLTVLSTIIDADAFAFNAGEKDYPNIADYLHMKSDAIKKLEVIMDKFYRTSYQDYFDYRHLRPYYPDIRFNELQEAASKGNVDINRTVALMLALGIGADKNLDSAIYRLKQCALWGDVPSLYFLAYLYQLGDREKECALYQELSQLSSYLLEGRTIIPHKQKDKYSKEAIELFAVISSIRQDIALKSDVASIDYAFVEVLLADKLDYYQKMSVINNYRDGAWKEVLHSSFNPDKKLGFKVKGE